MFRFFEKKRPERPKPEKSVNDKLLRMDIGQDQTDLLADKVNRLAEEMKTAASEENIKQSFRDAADAASDVLDAVEKEEGNRERSE